MPKEAFSSVDLIVQCLIDEPRSRALGKAIKTAVKPGHSVLDIGTGSGLLAMFAARAGAKEVKAIEFDPYIAETAKKNVEKNKLSDTVEVWTGDGRSFEFSHGAHFDVVVMEMLTTGMVDEFQVQTANNLQDQGVVSKKTVFIPQVQRTFVELANKDFTIYGLEFKMVQHLWNNLSENQKYSVLSDKVLLNETHFNRKNNEYFEKKILITPTKSGVVNSIRLSSRALLFKDTFLDDTETFNAPVIVPVKETSVTAGNSIQLAVRYRFGFGYQHFFAEIQ